MAGRASRTALAVRPLALPPLLLLPSPLITQLGRPLLQMPLRIRPLLPLRPLPEPMQLATALAPHQLPLPQLLALHPRGASPVAARPAGDRDRLLTSLQVHQALARVVVPDPLLPPLLQLPLRIGPLLPLRPLPEPMRLATALSPPQLPHRHVQL